jgi:hypothetical protein
MTRNWIGRQEGKTMEGVFDYVVYFALGLFLLLMMARGGG